MPPVDFDDVDLDTDKRRPIKWVERLNDPTEITIQGKRVTKPTRLIKDGSVIAIDWASEGPW